MSSTSFQSSQSSSHPTVTETPENQIIDQISGVASGLANQMLGWAQGVFAQTSQITNQAVGNFFQASQNMMGLANNMTSQYNNLFAPENAQLVADANSYNSASRQQVDMGMAGATQAQAGDAALKSSEESLRSFGINPSDGRYAALDKAAAVQNAANVAGAENLQRQQDITTGQNLRAQAVQVGAQLPAAIANTTNTAIQANTGASNASLANANTGANLMQLPDKFLQTAMGVKLPLQGQTSQSTGVGSSNAQHPSQPSSGGGGNGGAGAGNPFGPSGSAWMPQHGGASASSGAGGGRSSQPGSRIISNYDQSGLGNVDNFGDPSGQSYDPLGGIDPNSFDGGASSNIYQPQDGFNMGVGQPGTNEGFNDFSDPFADSGFGQTLSGNDFGGGGADQTFGGMGGGTNTEFGNISYDPAANNQGGASDWSISYDQPAPTDWGNGADQYSGAGSGSSYDTSDPNSDYYAGDYTAPSDSYDMGGAYAKGGAIPGVPNAGPVPRSMSPSGGRQVDDVRARGPQGSQINLNADEFVIPRDVALWKGQEFFQNLIDQSRKKRMTAPAHGSPNPPQQGRQPMPSSQPMR